MSHGEKPDTCRFGHVFKVHDVDGSGAGAPNSDIRDDIKSEDVWSFEDVKEHEKGAPLLRSIMGDHYKNVKLSNDSQGVPYTFSWVVADMFDEDLDYEVSKTSEDIFVAPQSNLHQEFMQRKQQAEQRVNQTLSGLSDLQQQKHQLEHDIRKLRSRVEALNSGKEGEIELKADFVELVDGAGGGAQQGSDEAPLKTLRDQNLYPSIVADFYEMRGLDDLKDGDESEFDTPRLNQLPRNEKAILKKKWVMYEKWKDLYGSEVKRKLEDLKGQLKNTERSMEETKNWLRPYIRDVSMINPKDRNLLSDGLDFYPTVQGTASMRRDLEFVCYMPLKKEELNFTRTSEDEATHYRVVVIHSVHVNLASGEQPNVPGGPSSCTVFWFPAIVCEHVFDNIFRDKIQQKQEMMENMIQDYTGEFEPDEQGQELREKRQEKEWSVREMREKVDEEAEDTDVPIEFSALLRRVEDGMENPYVFEEEYNEEVLDAVYEVLGMELHEPSEDSGMSDLKQKWLKLAGHYEKDPYTVPDSLENDPLDDLKTEMKFNYYYNLKIGFGMYTMK
ncbi:MAG: hypothetical protein ABEJ03_04530 [Candidatus Nanohaloarchaea archaeon]